jgi:protocatechuate 3,4-dioxygenase beta subunit
VAAFDGSYSGAGSRREVITHWLRGRHLARLVVVVVGAMSGVAGVAIGAGVPGSVESVPIVKDPESGIGGEAGQEGGQATASSVFGVVEDSRGHPVSAATVVVGERVDSAQTATESDSQSERATRSAVVRQLGSTVTDSSGRFAIRIPEEAVVISVLAWAPGYERGRKNVAIRAGAATAPVLMHLPDAMRVSGRIVSESGVPLAGATVSFQHKPGDMAGGVPRTASGSDGEFALDGLGHEPEVVKIALVGYETTRIAVSRESLKASQGLGDIVLKRGAILAGTVVDDVRMPIQDAIVQVWREGLLLDEGATDGDGSFECAGLERDVVYEVTAIAKAHVGATISSAPTASVVIALRRTNPLRGRVLDVASGLPIETFEIDVAPGSRTANAQAGSRAFSSEDGRFEWTDLPPGQLRVGARASGYPRIELPIQLRPGSDAQLDFGLKRGVDVRGYVADGASGAPVEGATVTWVYDGLQPIGRMPYHVAQDAYTTDRGGSFEIRGLPPSDVAITVSSPSHRSATQTIRAGEVSYVEFALKPGISVQGRVVTAGGSPVPSAAVQLMNLEKAITGGHATDPSGRFLFRNLSPGRYQIRAEALEGHSRPLELLLEDGDAQALDVQIVLLVGATIRGRVTGASEGPLQDVTIFAKGGGGSEATTVTDRAGNYLLRGFPAGVVEIQAQLSLQYRTTRALSVSEGAAAGREELILNIECAPQARLTGRVNQGGVGVANVVVSAMPADRRQLTGSATTDSSGFYRIDGLSRGEYLVSTPEGGAVSTVLNDLARVDIELPENRLSGVVVDASSNKPLFGASVDLEAVDRLPAGAFHTTTDELGRYDLRGLSRGIYRVIVSRLGYASDSRIAQISSSGVPMRVTLKPQ